MKDRALRPSMLVRPRQNPTSFLKARKAKKLCRMLTANVTMSHCQGVPATSSFTCHGGPPKRPSSKSERRSIAAARRKAEQRRAVTVDCLLQVLLREPEALHLLHGLFESNQEPEHAKAHRLHLMRHTWPEKNQDIRPSCLGSCPASSDMEQQQQ
jgi:hypothetical protein